MKNFLTDKDGMSSKDYLLVLSTGIFFFFILVGLISVMFGIKFDEMYITYLEMVSPVVMTIVGGVFGVQAVETFRYNKPDQKEKGMGKYDSRV